MPQWNSLSAKDSSVAITNMGQKYDCNVCLVVGLCSDWNECSMDTFTDIVTSCYSFSHSGSSERSHAAHSLYWFLAWTYTCPHRWLLQEETIPIACTFSKWLSNKPNDIYGGRGSYVKEILWYMSVVVMALHGRISTRYKGIDFESEAWCLSQMWCKTITYHNPKKLFLHSSQIQNTHCHREINKGKYCSASVHTKRLNTTPYTDTRLSEWVWFYAAGCIIRAAQLIQMQNWNYHLRFYIWKKNMNTFFAPCNFRSQDT